MVSNTRSGKSNTDISELISTKFFFLGDILEVENGGVSPERVFVMEFVRKERSFQNQRERSLISEAHGRSGLRGRDLKKRMKDKEQVNKKRSIGKEGAHTHYTRAHTYIHVYM